MYAVFVDSKACVDLLLHLDANINFADELMITPCMWAASRSSHKMLKYLIDEGGDWTMADTEGRTSLHYAVIQESTKCCTAIIKSGQSIPEGLDIADNENVTALSLALRRHNFKHAGVLIKAGASIGLPDNDGKTALHYIADTSETGMIKFLKEGRFADVPAIGADNEGSTPIHVSVARENYKLTQQILKLGLVDVNSQDATGRTALHWAGASGYKNIVGLLCDSGTDPTIVDNLGCSASHYAAQMNHVECAEVIQGHLQEDVTDQDGRTPLHWAVMQGNVEVMQALLAAGSDANWGDSEGRTPLHMAVLMQNEDILRLLVSCGADVNAVDGRKQSPIFLCCEMGLSALLPILIDAGALLELQDETRSTPMHYACINGHFEIAKYLMRLQERLLVPFESSSGHLTNYDLVDQSGKSYMIYAAYQGQLDVVQMLIDLKADIDIQDTDGVTALHWAALEGHVGIVKLLVSMGANFNLTERAETRYTSLDYAVHGNHPECVTALEEAGAIQTVDLQHWSVVAIQAQYRGHRARKMFRAIRGAKYAAEATEEEHIAATKLQTAVRRFLQRKTIDVKRQQMAVKKHRESVAAIKIQATFKGHLERKRFSASPQGQAYHQRRAQLTRAHTPPVQSPGVALLDDMVEDNAGASQADGQGQEHGQEQGQVPEAVRSAAVVVTPIEDGGEPQVVSSSSPSTGHPAVEPEPEVEPEVDLDEPFSIRPGETYAIAYHRHVVVRRKKRAAQDRVLYASLKAPLGKKVAVSTSVAAASVQTSKMLTSYKMKHVTRIMENKRREKTKALQAAAVIIQKAWRAYIMRKEAAHAAGLPFPTCPPRTMLRRLPPPRSKTGETSPGKVAGARAKSPRKGKRVVQVSRRNDLDHADRRRMGAAKLPVLNKSSTPAKTGYPSRTATGLVTKPLLPPKNRVLPAIDQVAGSYVVNPEKSLKPKFAAQTHTRRMKLLESATDAAHRHKARKAWDDTPCLEPPPDRFRQLYVAKEAKRKAALTKARRRRAAAARGVQEQPSAAQKEKQLNALFSGFNFGANAPLASAEA